MESLVFYKIVNPDGKFSTGGNYVTFHKVGKIWRTMAHINQHLKNVHDRYFYDNCRVVKYHYELKSEESNTVAELISSIDAAEKQKREKRKARTEAQIIKEETAELKRLMAKYDSFRADPD